MTALSVNQEKICIKLKTIWKWTSWFYTNDFMKIIQYQTLISITTLRLVIMTLPTKQFWIIMKSQKKPFWYSFRQQTEHWFSYYIFLETSRPKTSCSCKNKSLPHPRSENIAIELSTKIPFIAHWSRCLLLDISLIH